MGNEFGTIDVLGARELALRYYPEGRHTLRAADNGRPLFHLVEWDADAVRRRQGLLADPATRCAGQPPTAGWRGLLYVPERGMYQLRTSAPASCVQVDLRPVDALTTAMYLDGGWHEIDVTAPGPERPLLTTHQPGQAARATGPEWLFAGEPHPHGLLAAFSERAGAPPFQRRYLGMFDQSWPGNPPATDHSFYLEMTGGFDVKQAGQYELAVQVSGGLCVLVDGTTVIDAPPGPTGIHRSRRMELGSGRHALEIRYDARALDPTWARLVGPAGDQRLDVRITHPP